MWQSIYDWLTNANNPNLPKGEYLYGTRHFIVLGLVVFFCFLIYFVFRKKSDRAKNIFFMICASIFLFLEITFRVVKLSTDTITSFEQVFKIIVPLHFCSVAVWIILISILSKNKTLINITPIVGLLATFAYLAYPAVGLNSTYISFPAFYSIFSHSMGFVVCFSMISLKVSKFDIKKIWQSYLMFTIIILYGLLLNTLILPGSNYMYIMENPLPIDFGIPFQIVFAIILVLYVFSFYVPSFIKLLKAKVSKKNNR